MADGVVQTNWNNASIYVLRTNVLNNKRNRSDDIL